MAAREEFEPLIESDHSSSGGDDDAPIYVPVGGSSAPLSPRQPGTPLELYDPDQPHTHHLNREIRKAIKSVRAPPSSSSSGSVPGIEAKNGQLLKKKRKSNSWAKVTAQLDPSTGTITYSKNSSLSLKSKVSPTFALLLEQVVEDKVSHKQHKKGETVAKLRLAIWTKRRQILFSCDSDEELMEWYRAVKAILNHKFSSSELDQKATAAQDLVPLIGEQEWVQLLQYKQMRIALDDMGFMPYEKKTKLKEGYLRLSKNKSFDKLLWILQKKYLSYYRLSDKKLPIGIIALDFVVEINPISGSDFEIVTPLRSYRVRAKHDVAATEWINVLRQAKGKRARVTPDRIDIPVDESSSSAAFTGKVQLVYQVPKGLIKSRKITIPSCSSGTKSYTIGRSSSNTFRVPDINVSRNHGKFEASAGKPLVYYDMGSTKGSYLNGNSITVSVLKPGDQLRIGDTLLTVKAK